MTPFYLTILTFLRVLFLSPPPPWAVYTPPLEESTMAGALWLKNDAASVLWPCLIVSSRR